MIKELTVSPKPQNKKAKIAFLITLFVSFVGFAVYFSIERFRGIVGMFALFSLVTAILFYTKYIAPKFYYDITVDSENAPIFVVRQLTGKRQTTLSRIDLFNIREISKEEREVTRSHKTPAGFRRYVYAPTLSPSLVYRITVVGRYERAEIIIECSDEFADYLRLAVAEAKDNYAEEE